MSNPQSRSEPASLVALCDAAAADRKMQRAFLRELRRRMGMSQCKLAAYLGIHMMTVGAWESLPTDRRHHRPVAIAWETLRRLAVRYDHAEPPPANPRW